MILLSEIGDKAIMFSVLFIALFISAIIGALIITILIFILNTLKLSHDEPANYFKIFLVILSFFTGTLFVIGAMITALAI
jgi:hypothetical protein